MERGGNSLIDEKRSKCFSVEEAEFIIDEIKEFWLPTVLNADKNDKICIRQVENKVVITKFDESII